MDHQRVLDTLTESVRLVAPDVDITELAPELTLSDLGCNSIDRAEIVSITMEAVGADIPISALHKGSTIGELVRLFVQHS